MIKLSALNSKSVGILLGTIMKPTQETKMQVLGVSCLVIWKYYLDGIELVEYYTDEVQAEELGVDTSSTAFEKLLLDKLQCIELE